MVRPKLWEKIKRSIKVVDQEFKRFSNIIIGLDFFRFGFNQIEQYIFLFFPNFVIIINLRKIYSFYFFTADILFTRICFYF